MTPPMPKVGQILKFEAYTNRYTLVLEEKYFGYYRIQDIQTGDVSGFNVGLNYVNDPENNPPTWEIVSDPYNNT
jgi:hypothetical protein